ALSAVSSAPPERKDSFPKCARGCGRFFFLRSSFLVLRECRRALSHPKTDVVCQCFASGELHRSVAAANQTAIPRAPRRRPVNSRFTRVVLALGVTSRDSRVEPEMDARHAYGNPHGACGSRDSSAPVAPSNEVRHG